MADQLVVNAEAGTAEAQIKAAAVEEEKAEKEASGGEEQKEEKDEERPEPTEIEVVAMEQGWVPEEEYEANPDNKGKPWHNAITHVRNQKKVSDSHRKHSKELHRQVEKNNKDLQEFLANQKDQLTAARKNERAKVLAELHERQDAAVDDENKEEVRKITNEIAALAATDKAEEAVAAAEKVETEETEKASPADAKRNQQIVDQWVADSDYYEDKSNPLSPLLRSHSDQISADIVKANPTWGMDLVLAETDRQVNAIRAQLQPKKEKRTASAAGNGKPATKSERKTPSDLTPDEKQKGLMFVEMGTYKNLQEYVDDLHEQKKEN